jgi:HAD superfamily hydrolase (TIGR01509 family)
LELIAFAHSVDDLDLDDPAAIGGETRRRLAAVLDEVERLRDFARLLAEFESAEQVEQLPVLVGRLGRFGAVVIEKVLTVLVSETLVAAGGGARELQAALDPPAEVDEIIGLLDALPRLDSPDDLNARVTLVTGREGSYTDELGLPSPVLIFAAAPRENTSFAALASGASRYLSHLIDTPEEVSDGQAMLVLPAVQLALLSKDRGHCGAPRGSCLEWIPFGGNLICPGFDGVGDLPLVSWSRSRWMPLASRCRGATVPWANGRSNERASARAGHTGQPGGRALAGESRKDRRRGWSGACDLRLRWGPRGQREDLQRGAREHDRAEVFHRELRPVPGAAETVARISAAGVAVCVASQGKAEKTRLSLDLTGLLGLFPGGALFSAYSVPRGKPHSDLFLHAAASMGARPSSCVVVEDTPSGVTAAVAARMRVFGYAADSDEMTLRHAGAEILWSLEDLPALLGQGLAA